MKNNRIRLTESQLHKVIKESVNKVLKEYDDYEDGLQVNTDFDDLYNVQHFIEDAKHALKYNNKEGYNRAIEIVKNMVNRLPMV